jgi:CMP-N-acetylneuraminic acid synthetase
MIAIVPIRSGSKGIPNKNIKILAGKPLVWWVLNSLEQSKVNKIIVPTDPEYKQIIKNFKFSKLEIYNRNKKNSTDVSSTEDVLLETISNLKLVDDIMLVQSTSPLTTFKDINEGIKLYNNYDSILSVVKQKRFIWNSEGKSLNYNYRLRPRRQDWGGYFVENGAFYINHSSNILRDENRLSGKIGLCEMGEKTYYEIDSLDDWEIVENLIKNK